MFEAPGWCCENPGLRRAASAKTLFSIERSTSLKPMTSTTWCSVVSMLSFLHPIHDHLQFLDQPAGRLETFLRVLGHQPGQQRLAPLQVGGQLRHRLLDV